MYDLCHLHILLYNSLRLSVTVQLPALHVSWFQFCVQEEYNTVQQTIQVTILPIPHMYVFDVHVIKIMYMSLLVAWSQGY